jgi:hypothetical protein
MAKKIKWPKIFFGKKEKSIEDKVQELKDFNAGTNGLGFDVNPAGQIIDTDGNIVSETSLYDWLLGYRNSTDNSSVILQP